MKGTTEMTMTQRSEKKADRREMKTGRRNTMHAVNEQQPQEMITRGMNRRDIHKEQKEKATGRCGETEKVVCAAYRTRVCRTTGHTRIHRSAFSEENGVIFQKRAAGGKATERRNKKRFRDTKRTSRESETSAGANHAAVFANGKSRSSAVTN